MNLRLLYLARLREALGTGSESLDVPAEVVDVASLLAHLRERGGIWKDELSSGRAFRVAVNQDMAREGTALQAGDEVAIFPPVTGG
ncbi:MAG: molybdopterin converting factor subunit 1 [Betaproteobacteria bacterium]|jgi:molybdopterin synthase sulfur carrier subunit|nr:molybdopterin converting factor subunit 1 [Betaproteobacteria bacterium]